MYLATLTDLGRGVAWLDTGTHESLIEAGPYVPVLENRQGVRIACIEEVALRMGFIDAQQCLALGEAQKGSGYGEYVVEVARSFGAPDQRHGAHAQSAMADRLAGRHLTAR